MFPLSTATFPASASDLERLLNHSLQRIFSVEADPVSIRDASYPHIEALRVALDRARLSSNPPRPPSIAGKTSPALQVDRLHLSALALSIDPATIDLSLSARTVSFVQGKDSDDQVILSLENAADGKIEISVGHSDLEALITDLARTQASTRGITIDDVHLKLQQKKPHSLAAEARLSGRKSFLSVSIQVTGQLDLDDQLNLKISDLNCTGAGGIATLACGILKPYLQKVDGREFPLMSLPLGEIRLRDIRLTVGDKVCITAEFGSAT